MKSIVVVQLIALSRGGYLYDNDHCPWMSSWIGQTAFEAMGVLWRMAHFC